MKYNANSKAHYVLLQALNDDNISNVTNCTCTHDIWQVLVTTHEGITQVKKAKIDLLSSHYDSSTMFDEESIDDMLTRLTTITNVFISLGKPIDNDQKVRKIIRALSKTWEVKSTWKELNNTEHMDFIAFMESLKTHEMEMKTRKDREPQKENGVPLKACSREFKKKSASKDEEELTLLVKNVNIYLKNKKRSDPRRKGKKKAMKTLLSFWIVNPRLILRICVL